MHIADVCDRYEYPNPLHIAYRLNFRQKFIFGSHLKILSYSSKECKQTITYKINCKISDMGSFTAILLASAKLQRKSTVSYNVSFVNKGVMYIGEKWYPCIFLVVKVSKSSNASFKVFTHSNSPTSWQPRLYKDTTYQQQTFREGDCGFRL